jgi:hypothetical protein
VLELAVVVVAMGLLTATVLALVHFMELDKTAALAELLLIDII